MASVDSGSPVYVKLTYFSYAEGSVVANSKNVKVARQLINQHRFKNLIHTVLGTYDNILLLRKSKRENDYVELSTQADYKSLERSLKVKNYIKLLVVDEKEFDTISKSAIYSKHLSSENISSGSEESLAQTIGVTSVAVEKEALQELSQCIKVVKKNMEELCVSMKGIEEQKKKDTVDEEDAKYCSDAATCKGAKCNDAAACTRFSAKFYCDGICDSSREMCYLEGPRFRCTVCPNFDLCQDCAFNGFIGGGHTSNHLFVKHDNGKQSEPMPFHYNITCDGCDNPVFGPRFKCLDCANYDLCQSCANEGIVSYGHEPHHEMLRTMTPKPHLIPCGKYSDMPLAQAQTVASIPYVSGPQNCWTGRYCDSCYAKTGRQCDIKSIYFKCVQCADYDECKDCFLNSQHNPTHKMEAFVPAEEVAYNTWFQDVATANFIDFSPNRYCDACPESTNSVPLIRAIDYRCLNCQEYDLCERCYKVSHPKCCSAPRVAAVLPAELFKVIPDNTHPYFKILAENHTRELPLVGYTEESSNEGILIDLELERSSDLAVQLQNYLENDRVSGLEKLVTKANAFDVLCEAFGVNNGDVEEKIDKVLEQIRNSGEHKNPFEEDANPSSSNFAAADATPEVVNSLDIGKLSLSQGDDVVDEADVIAEAETVVGSADENENGSKEVEQPIVASDSKAEEEEDDDSASFKSTMEGSKTSLSVVVLPKLLKESSVLTLRPETLPLTEDDQSATDDLDSMVDFVDVENEDIVSSAYDSDEATDDLLFDYEVLDSDMDI